MDQFRVIITPRFGWDLEVIHQRIAKDSAENASKMIKRIWDALEPLKQFPHRTIVEHQENRLKYPVRSLPVPPYVIYFRVLDDAGIVRVLHVRHGVRRQPRRFDS